MKITDLQVNHKKDPMGYAFNILHFQWKISDAGDESVASVRLCVWEASCKSLEFRIYDSGYERPVAWDGMDVSLGLMSRVPYYWKVMVLSDRGNEYESDFGRFETGKMDDEWKAKWLSFPEDASSAVVFKHLDIESPVRDARMYVCGLGLYEVYVDDQKVGDEYLMPGYYSYDLTLEYQTLDLTGYLSPGSHTVSILLGNGWYRGRFVFEGGYENLYGNCLKASAEIYVQFMDRKNIRFMTDDSWEARTTFIGSNNIYDGEIQDYHLAGNSLVVTSADSCGREPVERSGMPLKITARYAPKEILHTPAGETVLDFGEMITGWVELRCREPKDSRIRLLYGELLQDGNFYRDNLRTAKAEFQYISDGRDRWVRPHFTYYGFRYVRVEGISSVYLEDFEAVRLMSTCERTGSMETGDKKVNRLIANINASQDCNFLDIPTDCPQRDERMGWTGDIAVFADTACLNRDCAGFLDHYMKMMALEQEVLGGIVPVIVPRPKLTAEQAAVDPMLSMCALGTCAWGDAGTVIPWTLFEHYRDKDMLASHYPVMKAWVSYVEKRVEANPKPHLWQNDLQLADWLALDNTADPASPFGLTDPGLIATACYYHSLELALRAARILRARGSSCVVPQIPGLPQDIRHYDGEMEAVRNAFAAEYLNEDGTLKVVETQTAYAVILAYGLVTGAVEEKAAERLDALVRENDFHLTTGFVGTPLLCPALSSHGYHETACRLFLQESYPGWLHEVDLGAVSLWERWNSLDEEGKVSSTGMNSMNHYAYGSIGAWMYRYLCGFQTDFTEERTIKIAPMPCRELGWMKGSYQTPWGMYEICWKITGEDEAEYKVTIPTLGNASLILPGQDKKRITAGTHHFTGGIGDKGRKTW